MSTASTPDVGAERRALLQELLIGAGELQAADQVSELTQLEGGWSRFSHIAVARTADGTERRYVVRVKAPAGLFDTELVAEYNIFAGLQDLDLPTPAVFALHEDPDNPFGGEFFVMEYLSGHSSNVWRAKDHVALQADWDGPKGLARDMVTYAARIHAVGADHAPDGLPTVTFLEHVARWRGEYDEAGFNRDPVLEEAFHWLVANAPEPTRIGLVHGDYRIGNMLMADGRVTAILDWELAYMGDPRFDLGYMFTDYISGKHLRPKTTLVGAIAERDWFVSEYERLSGEPLDREAVRAFSVLGLVALMTMSYTGLRRWQDGSNNDFRRAWARYGLPGMRQELTQLLQW